MDAVEERGKVEVHLPISAQAPLRLRIVAPQVPRDVAPRERPAVQQERVEQQPARPVSARGRRPLARQQQVRGWPHRTGG